MAVLLIALLAVAAGLLLIKLLLMRRTLRELSDGVDAALSGETNAPLTVASRDGALRAHAERLNAQLRLLRDERRRFQRGDRELKEAVTALSHDMRTPLTAMGGYLDLLGREPLTEDARRYLSLIEGRAEALERLSEEFFRYSVATEGRPLSRERVSLRAALEEALLAMEAAVRRRGVEPEIELPDAPVYRALDPEALSRVFSNILNNALKYSGGDLSVAMDAAGRIRFSNRAERLTDVDVARLFERYYTVETGRGATGLGLFIARQLTERMGGSISASCRDGRLAVELRFPEEDEHETLLPDGAPGETP